MVTTKLVLSMVLVIVMLNVQEISSLSKVWAMSWTGILKKKKAGMETVVLNLLFSMVTASLAQCQLIHADMTMT